MSTFQGSTGTDIDFLDEVVQVWPCPPVAHSPDQSTDRRQIYSPHHLYFLYFNLLVFLYLCNFAFLYFVFVLYFVYLYSCVVVIVAHLTDQSTDLEKLLSHIMIKSSTAANF